MGINSHRTDGPHRKGPDTRWTIVRETVSKTSFQIQGQVLSQFDLENIIDNTAVECGARGDLLAAMMRHLPQIYLAVQSANLDAKESDISSPVRPQYEIWAQGQHKIAEDISAYEKRKDRYLFWANVTNEEYKSLGEKRGPLSAPALRLLLFLAENIGISVPRSEAFKHVIGITSDGQEGWKGRLAHYLTELQNFSGGNFRKLYLPPPDRFTDTLTLRRSFREKYFVFITLNSPLK